MKWLILITTLLTTIPPLFGQPYGNEWINFSKSYYRVQTSRDAIYRISYADLDNVGFPVSTIDPRRFQLFFRGEEVAIHVEGQNDAHFNVNDYIEFYGRKNDGTVDAGLYPAGEVQPHDLYNIFSDTTAFFLTYNLTPANGKRMRTYAKNNVSNLAPVAYHLDQRLVILTDEYAVGKRFATEDVVQLTRFDTGEGWTGRKIQEGEQSVIVIEGIENRVTPTNANLEIVLQGRDNVPHQAEIRVSPDGSSYRSLGTTTWNDYASRTFSTTLADTDIGGDGAVRVQVICQGQGGNDLMSTSYVRITYRQSMNASGVGRKFFTFTGITGNEAFFQVNNPAAGSQLMDVTDPLNPERIGTTVSGGQLRAIVENAGIQRKLLLTNSPAVPLVKKSSIRSIDPAASQYVIISHSLLRQSAGGYDDPVKAIGTYRASAQGGGYDTIIVNVDQLYDQFSYGETTPLAIFRFMELLKNEGNPEYLFIIGKGMDPNENFYRNSLGYIVFSRYGNTYKMRNLVPSAGVPASDMVFGAGIGGSEILSPVSTGRIPATSASQVAAYLDKIKSMESQPYNDLYRKEILHLSGGISAQELVRFNNFVNSFAAVAEGPYLGGRVTTVKKNNTEIISLINISEEINEGKNLVTFFGHSAPNVTDIDIGFVTDPALGYNNPDKYPSMLLNGCLSGQFFTYYMVFGEDWILARNKGAQSMIAHTSFGFENTLKRYSDLFYATAYGDSVFINQPIGKIQQEVARRYMQTAAPNEVNISQVQQMLLLGDPASYLFGAPKPDFETNSNQLFLATENDEPLTGRVDHFILNVITRNFGKAYQDSIHVHVNRVLNDNSSELYDSVFAAPLYQDTLRMLIPNGNVNGTGSNKFSVQLDPANEWDELNENNNSGILNVFIPSNSTFNIFPSNYGIIAEPTVILMVQSTDPLPQNRSFTLEIDTSRFFNSPAIQQTTLTAGLLASWTVDLLPDNPPGDSIVYFWRSKYTNPQGDESEEWANSSFVYIHESAEGWSQSVYHQLIENTYNRLQADDDRRILKFQERTTQLAVYTGGSLTGLPRADHSLQVNGIEYNINNTICPANSFNFIAFDKTYAIPFLGLPYTSGDPRTCGRQPQIINTFIQSNIEAAGGAIDYLNALPAGDPVIAFNVTGVNYPTWSPALKNAFGQIGVSPAEVATWQNGEPIIIIGRKGALPGTAQVIKTDQTPPGQQFLSFSGEITGYETDGELFSKLIGPAKSWQNLYFEVSSKPNDSYRLELWGIGSDGTESMLLPDVTASPTDLSTVDVVAFPFLQLRLYVSDEISFDAPILQKWIITYEQPPEGVILVKNLEPSPVNVLEGDQVVNEFGFLNISNKDFPDSLTVKTQLFNQNSRLTQNFTKKIKGPAPGDTTKFEISTSTGGKAGKLDYQVFVNPRLVPEIHYDNNFIDIPGYLNVQGDNINPVVDVVFDGEYILDGDIVSPTPLITAKIKDNNPYLLKQDTAGVNLLFKPVCDQCEYQRIPFSADLLTWYPAEDNTPFRLEFRPEKLEDGLYSLRLDAADASGNKSGEEPYEITFEVINESTITNFYPYPNPFSSSTRFVFTLTGATIPDAIKIQIMTVSGKVVREITQDELGPVHIGHNLSDYAWDGRDEYGDQLANGVYIYRVLIRNQGEQIEHRATAGDRGFTKGYGKLYLLR